MESKQRENYKLIFPSLVKFFKLHKQSKLILIFTAVYFVFFTLIAFMRKNYEFLYYTAIMSSLIILIVLYYKKLHLTSIILWGLSILGFMHLGGGLISISGNALYGFWIIQDILRYDNVVHTFGIFIATFVAYNIISPHLDLKTKHHPVLFSLLLVLIALGIGSLNEVAEFVAVIFLGEKAGVGDYFNNALDLVFNLIGSIIAVFIIFPYHRKGRLRKKSG